MKKEATILLVISILIISSIIFVSAQDEEPQINMPKAGITPDSIFYGFDVFFDNVRAALTFRSVNRAKVRLDIMEERMAEMEQMAENNKVAEAERAESQVRKQMQNFEGAVEKVKKRDAPELQEHIQTYAERLEIWKQRLENYDIPDYADAIAEALALLETTENVIINIPEDLGDDATFMITAMCKEAGATTIAECNELIASGALIAVITSGSESYVDPHNCSGFWASNETKWCCEDSDGYYSPEQIEQILSGYDEHVSDVLGSSPHMLDYYHRKGTVEYKIINLETEEIEQGIETDSCDGDTLTEWLCPTSMNPVTQNKRYSEEYECPNGCQDGACIGENGPEEIVECTDSDGGKDYFAKGTTVGRTISNFTSSQTDICIDNSTLAEFFCGENNLVLREEYTCPNGCEDGVCIQ